MIIKKFLCAISSAFLLLSAVSCGNEKIVREQKEQTVISLSWWGNDKRHEYTIEAVKKFQLLHPDIKVNINYSEWSGYEARSRIQMTSNTEADVMQINFNWLGQFSPDGDGYYDINTLRDYVDLSSFSEDMLEYGTVKGRLNGVPIAMNSMTVYINKTVYEKYGLDIPETWDDLFNAAKVMSKDGIYPLSGAAKQMWLFCMSYVEQKTGKSFITSKGTIGFNSDDFRDMIDMYCRLVNEKVIPQIEYFERINLNDGKYAGTVAWVSDAINYCGTAMENGFEYVCADYISIDPSLTGYGWTAKPATLYAVSKNTDHPKEAAMLLDFLLNSKEAALLQGVEKGIPLSTDARRYLEEDGQLQGLQYEASQLMENNPRIREMDPFVENNDVISNFIDSCNLVLFNKANIEKVASEFARSTNKIYSS